MLTTQHLRLFSACAILGSLLLTLALTYDEGTPKAFAKAQEGERSLKDEIPEHVPLRARIKKEKEKGFKDLKNENWARELEVEVTNIGNRPIYEFYLYLVFDVKDISGQDILAPIYYGRDRLGDHRVRATPEDIPLKPGESCTLKIHPGQLGAWDKKNEEDRPHPKKIRVVFQLLSFGDGTGLVGPDGAAVPRKLGPQSTTSSCAPTQIRSGPILFEWRGR